MYLMKPSWKGKLPEIAKDIAMRSPVLLLTFTITGVNSQKQKEMKVSSNTRFLLVMSLAKS